MMAAECREIAILQAWQTQLQALYAAICTAPAASSPQGWHEQFAAVSSCYQTQIMTIEPLRLGHPQGQSLWTEIHRLMRLVSTQWCFWQTARSRDKQTQAQQAIATQLQTLVQLVTRLTAPSPDTPQAGSRGLEGEGAEMVVE